MGGNNRSAYANASAGQATNNIQQKSQFLNTLRNETPTSKRAQARFSVILIKCCAGNGSRTHMTLRSGNFKSPAYTIPPSRQLFNTPHFGASPSGGHPGRHVHKIARTRYSVHVPIWHGGEAVTLRSAKPSCAGSIPARASVSKRM